MTELLRPALDLGTIFSRRPPTLDFVLPGLVAGHVGAIVAPGSTGKSYLELQIAIGLAGAVPIAEGGLPTPSAPQRVVVLAGEDDEHVLAVRLHAIIDRLTAGHDGTGELFTTAARAELVERLKAHLDIHSLHGSAPHLIARPDTPCLADELSRRCQGARLVILDPLRRFHGGDENDSAVMTRLVQAIEQIAKDTGAAVIVAHHTNKAATLNGLGDQQQAIRGSSALTDAIRWQANLLKMSVKEADELGVDSDERGYFLRLEIVKSNYVPPQPTVWLRRLQNGVLKHVTFAAPRTPPRKGVRHGG